jgi:hypothetical protein
MTVSTLDDARVAFFRALLGDEPAPTAEQLRTIKHSLTASPTVCAALDDLVSIIVRSKRTVDDRWRTRLHAYIMAQLDGRATDAEFADVRQALDASVELSEEYALLYETMQAERQNTVPLPLDMPGPDLSFLTQSGPASTPSQTPSDVSWWRKRALSPLLSGLALAIIGLVLTWRGGQQTSLTGAMGLVVGLVLVTLGTLLGWQWRQTHSSEHAQPFGHRLQPLVLLACLFLLVFSMWTTLPQVRIQRETAPFSPTAERMQPAQPSFLELQMELEATLPTPLAIYQAEPAPLLNRPCIDYLRGLLFRRACPL